MARTVRDVLDDRKELRSIREQVDALGLPNKGRVLDAIDSIEMEASAEAGGVVWPADEEQSRLITDDGGLLRYSREAGKFEEVEGEDPASIVVEADEPVADELPPPEEDLPPIEEAVPDQGFPTGPAMAPGRSAAPRARRG